MVHGCRAPAALLLVCGLQLAGCAGTPGAEASPPPATDAVPRPDRGLIRFGVGPVLPTPEETRRAFEPFFAHLAGDLGYASFDLQEATEWASIGVALASEQIDVAAYAARSAAAHPKSLPCAFCSGGPRDVHGSQVAVRHHAMVSTYNP